MSIKFLNPLTKASLEFLPYPLTTLDRNSHTLSKQLNDICRIFLVKFEDGKQLIYDSKKRIKSLSLNEDIINFSFF